MDLLFPDEGLVYQLSKTLATAVKYHLYTNALVPTLSTVLANLTEATWAGYVSVAQDWTAFTIQGVSAHNGYAIAPPINFTNTSGAPVSAYGYYVTDSGATKLLAVAAFDSPPITIANLGNYSVTPTWGNFSALSS
jgi:hypothetical protein